MVGFQLKCWVFYWLFTNVSDTKHVDMDDMSINLILSLDDVINDQGSLDVDKILYFRDS